MMRIFILAARLPRFTPTNEVTYEQIVEQALLLEIPEVVSVVRQAFLAAPTPTSTMQPRRERHVPCSRASTTTRALETENPRDPMEKARRARARDRHRHLCTTGAPSVDRT